MKPLKGLIIAWIIFYAFLFFANVFLLLFISAHESGLREMNQLGFYTFLWILGSIVWILGFLRILHWFKTGEFYKKEGMRGEKWRYVLGLIVSIFLIFYGVWKLYDFFKPKVGPIGNGPSDTLVNLVWLIFGVNMLLGVGGVIYFAYSLYKKENFR